MEERHGWSICCYSYMISSAAITSRFAGASRDIFRKSLASAPGTRHGATYSVVHPEHLWGSKLAVGTSLEIKPRQVYEVSTMQPTAQTSGTSVGGGGPWTYRRNNFRKGLVYFLANNEVMKGCADRMDL